MDPGKRNHDRRRTRASTSIPLLFFQLLIRLMPARAMMRQSIARLVRVSRLTQGSPPESVSCRAGIATLGNAFWLDSRDKHCYIRSASFAAQKQASRLSQAGVHIQNRLHRHITADQGCS